jgi:5'-nucleotidase
MQFYEIIFNMYIFHVKYLLQTYFCTMSKPLILVTNDDGIAAPGIRALLEVAASFGEVIVVAPDSPQSGKGHAITIHDPLRLKKVSVFEGIEAWECSGTPVDCVKLAKHVILKDRPIALCVSGINHGSNASINILYSGTLSAAMEAALEGIRSIGFSLLDFSFDADFEASRIWAGKVIEYMLSQPFRQGCLLNVNIPKLSPSEIRGMKVCRQANARWVEKFVEGRDPGGRPYYWLTGEFINEDTGDDTDVWALENGYVSVVPSMHDLTNYTVLKELSELESV